MKAKKTTIKNQPKTTSDHTTKWLKESPLHLIGIGGIGMSGIAKLLHQKKVPITGSDRSESPITKALASNGIPIQMGHAPQLVLNAKGIIVSSAIETDNPEYIAATQNNLPIYSRAEILNTLMKDAKHAIAISGTHGKSTTAACLAYLLNTPETPASYAIGAELNNFKTNAHLGAGEYFIAEADESDGSFLDITPSSAIITNIENESNNR